MEKLKRFFIGPEILALSRGKKIVWVLSVILMIVCMISFEMYLDRTLERETDSDVSSELILSDLLAKEGKIITSNWYYSTEIRLLNTNLVFAPLFRFFHNWHKIRLCGTIILHLALLLSAYFLCRKTRITIYFPAVGLMLLLPFSSGYYSFILRFPFYVPHIVISLSVFSLVIWYSESNGGIFLRTILLLVCGAISLLAGMGGARQVIICLIPLFVSVFLPYIQNKIKTPIPYPDCKWNRYLVIVSLCVIAGCIGYYLNTTVLVKKFHFFVFNISFSDFDANKIFTAMGGLLQSLGYRSGAFETRVLFHNATAVILLAGSVIFAIRGIKTGWQTSNAFYFYACFYAWSIVIFLLLYAFTDMFYAERYNLPIVVLSAPMIAMGLRYLNDYRRGFKTIILLAWCGAIALSGYDFVSSKGITEEKTDHQLIADYLVNNGYYDGYAAFGNANILTELSNGRIDVHDWSDPLSQADGDVDRTYKWLQLVDHDTQRPDGKVFLLFHNDQIKPNMDPDTVADQKLWKLNDNRIIFAQGDYSVYGYESYNDMVSEIYDYDFVFQNGNWIKNGEDLQGVRILKENGISYGPYIEFREGRYRVTVRGNGLSRADFSCTYDSGENKIDIEMVSSEDQEAVYEFSVTERVADGETIVINPSADKIEIYSEQIDYLGPIADE